MQLSKSSLLALLVVLSPSAWAVDTTRCPQEFVLRLSGISPAKSSTYENAPGWRQSQADLSTSTEKQLRLKLAGRTRGACRFAGSRGVMATLKTVTERHPDGEVVVSDRLSVRFPIRASRYDMYFSISNYQPSGLRAPDEGKRRTIYIITQNYRYAVGLAVFDFD